MAHPLLARAWERWKKIAHAIGVFQSRVILTVMYYVMVLPFGVFVRLFKDPLGLRGRARSSAWIERETRDLTLEDLSRQS